MAAARDHGDRVVPIPTWHEERFCPVFRELRGAMGVRRNSSRLLLVLLLDVFLLDAMFAHAASEAYPLRIKVLTSETHAVNGGTEVPKDCDLQNFSAYCNESRNPTSQSIMLVQDEQGKSYRITCTTDSRWSKCAPLPVGEMFEARKEKKGMTILYRNSKGKEIKQQFQLAAVVSAPQSSAGVSPKSSSVAVPQSTAAVVPQPRAAAPSQYSPAPAPTPPAGWVRQVPPEKVSEKIRCNFSSTPPGAEITLDGKYMGNTPSEIGVSTGTHVVAISMPGFAEWKRELTVAADSAVNVTASLQKAQP
jgi:hypothetical protein